MDIRKILEDQLEALHEQSKVLQEHNPAELTHAMLAIVEVLYPDGVPEVPVTSKLVANIQVDTDAIVSRVVDTLNNKVSTVSSKNGEHVISIE